MESVDTFTTKLCAGGSTPVEQRSVKLGTNISVAPG
jgi:hypothetical protein